MLRSAETGSADALPWPVIAFIAFCGIFLVTGFALSTKRQIAWFRSRNKSSGGQRNALTALVAARRFGYLAEDPARTQYFTGVPFGVATRSRANDVVWGSVRGRQFETFALTVYGWSTQHDNTDGATGGERSFQITWIPLRAQLPRLRFEPDSAEWPAAESMGARDLTVESAQFNQLWKAVCDDERIGRAILTPSMIERFLQPDLYGMVVSIEGLALWIASPGASDLIELDSVVDQLYSIAGLIPAFVFDGHAA